MDSEEYVFDTVKFEKMKAMERYNRFRKMKKLLQVFEVLVALTLISWSSTYLPQAFKVSGDFFFQLSGYVFKPHVVFVIGNAIIVALVVLCRENDAGHDHNSGSGDVYDDYVRQTQAQRQPNVVSVPEADKNTPTPAVAEEMNDAGEIAAEEKQIVYVAPVEKKLKQPDEEKPEMEVKEKKLEQEEQPEKTAAVAHAIEDATKEIQKFQRTQSVKLKREIAAVPRLELRRSETYRRSATSSFESVDNLSNEEFNHTVAAFIKRHQQFLMQQKLEEKEEI